ncbi:MAG: hypothetical protein HYX46_00065 [Betaproteobacteria bacterium]|nr:hypothetical protein [Betaproteobacteria bacterium]
MALMMIVMLGLLVALGPGAHMGGSHHSGSAGGASEQAAPSHEHGAGNSDSEKR